MTSSIGVPTVHSSFDKNEAVILSKSQYLFINQHLFIIYKKK